MKRCLGIMGVKAQKEQKESLQECAYCNIRYSIDTRFCDNCSRPLNIVDALEMEKEQEERTKSLILETLRQEHSNRSKTSINKKLEEENHTKQKEIEDLKKILSQISG